MYTVTQTKVNVLTGKITVTIKTNGSPEVVAAHSFLNGFNAGEYAAGRKRLVWVSSFPRLYSDVSSFKVKGSRAALENLLDELIDLEVTSSGGFL